MLSDGITKEYQRLEQLGGYSDAAEVQLNMVRWVLEIAVRLEGLEAKLGPLAKALEQHPETVPESFPLASQDRGS